MPADTKVQRNPYDFKRYVPTARWTATHIYNYHKRQDMPVDILASWSIDELSALHDEVHLAEYRRVAR